MDDSSLINNICHNMNSFINPQLKVSDLITITREWNLSNLKNILPQRILNKIYDIPIPINNIDDKVT